MSVWREILDSGVLAEGAALTLRMDEFIRQVTFYLMCHQSKQCMASF